MYRSIKKSVVATGLAAGISACTTIDAVNLPEFEKNEFYFASDVLHTFECELKDTIKHAHEKGVDLSNKVAAVTLTMTLTEVTSVGGNVSLVVPVGPSKWSIAPGYTPTATGVRSMDIKSDYVIKDFSKCSDTQNANQKASNDAPRRLDGGLGLKEWIEELGRIRKSVGHNPQTSSYKVSFQIKEAGGGGPKIENAVKTESATITTSVDRTIKHELAITFSEVKKQSAPRTKAQTAVEEAVRDAFTAQDRFLNLNSID